MWRGRCPCWPSDSDSEGRVRPRCRAALRSQRHLFSPTRVACDTAPDYDDDSEEERHFLWKIWRSSSTREVPSPTRQTIKSCTPRRRPVLSRGAPKACAAALLLMGLTAFAAISLAQKAQPSESELAKRPSGLTAKELLGSTQLTSAATQALLETVRQQETWQISLRAIPQNEKDLVRHTVEDTFATIRKAVETAGLAEELDSFALTEGQLDAFLSTMQHMADTRIQEIGSSLADAFGRYFQLEGTSAGKEGLKLHLLRALQPQIAEIRSLWREVKMGLLHGPGLGWGVSVDPSRLFMVRSFDPSHPYWPPPKLQCEAAGCVTEGAFEEARILLLQMEALLETFGMRVEVQETLWSLPAHRPVPFLAELLACKAEEPQPFQKVSCK
ncbi:unnamed protein product [Durusdinium trenchii]|uniref:Uncharacterized protein n=1 Tax=Durusdinium trenchii TaxID=1381693 RepID=A0ABP0I3H0_9DINO